jgi:hypothetical protein
MTTTYTDAQIEADAKYLDYLAVRNDDPECDQIAARLRSILSERQAAMQGQGGEETTPEIFPGTHASLSALSIQSKDNK